MTLFEKRAEMRKNLMDEYGVSELVPMCHVEEILHMDRRTIKKQKLFEVEEIGRSKVVRLCDLVDFCLGINRSPYKKKI